MRRIDHDRQMRLRFQDGDSVEIEGVARCVFECPDAALAEEHIHVALAQNVFGAHDQVADPRAVAAFEHDGEMAAADFFQQRKILHVARADLEAVRVFLDHREISRVHDFRDDGQTGLAPRFGEKPETVFP